MGISWGVTLALAYAEEHVDRVSGLVLGAVTTGTRQEIEWITRTADPDQDVRDAAAAAWCRWEDTHVSLMPGWTPDPRFADRGFASVFARLVTHYWANDCFLPEGQLLLNLPRITHLPAVIVHGRHDVSGPLGNAWSLHKSWPGSELVVLGAAGHGGQGFGRR